MTDNDWNDETPTPAVTAPAKKAAKKAVEQLSVNDPELRTVTLKIYLNLSQGRLRNYDPAHVAAQAVREARAFLDAVSRADEIIAATGEDDGLDFASCPNLPPDHPFNLKSKRYGNQKTLAEYKALAAPGNEDNMRRRMARLN